MADAKIKPEAYYKNENGCMSYARLWEIKKMSEEDRAKAIKEFNDDKAIERQPFLHSYYEMRKELLDQGFLEEEIEDMYQTEKRILPM